MSQSLADMRRNYARDGLTESQAPEEPFALFHQWFGAVPSGGGGGGETRGVTG
jgi:pyridoxine/pyridoxamine 5'-phosphate oxidase